ncbi:MAG: hypothetical protein CFE23_14160 [Flavobacterium sp. BFFFF1]|uniref:hypothetical protein n=1 Tax=Flavobacterium sp. BFFFF1 TaxID=2015557 RepID=UPI000BC84FB1|nr:hypothetical protein [Flavobacterium sp. BFFFF1]OYU79439.1 MAG: hypothetical protein CFE23_14160 [Flavobacterium sp. BFFFF1]
MFKNSLAALVLLLSLHTHAQETTDAPERYTAHNKGKFFVSWGGNRESYSRSDVRFWGDNYDFTVYDMEAHDKPKGYQIDYVNPARMTIPQTNFRMGYFINDHYSISVGWDHMKYVMTQDQIATVNGFINLDASEEGAIFNGNYNDAAIPMTKDFLQYEHTDGLNYVNTEFSRTDDISKLFKIGNTDKIQVNVTEGVGAGILFPKTNTTLLGKERHDAFHVSGYGASLKAGLNITFFKHFYLQGEIKGGYINMPDIRTTQSASDHASQHFLFLQRIISVGGIFRV